MKKTYPRATFSAIFCAAIFCASMIGCREELGPARLPTARVRGRATVRGEPIGGGWIEFHPIEGALGDTRSAPLGLDGRFDADRVPLGPNAIRLAHPTVLPRSLSGLGRLPVILRKIEKSEQVLDLDLAREARRIH